MGGWSIGFHREGFECIGVDLVDVGYPYKLLKADLSYCMPTITYYDVVVASPPCTEFSVLTRLSYQKGLRGKPEPEKGAKLVQQAKHWIEEFSPRYWLIENVFGAVPFLAPILGTPRIIAKPWVLWGNFPDFFLGEIPKGEKKISHNYEKPRLHGTRPPDDFPFNPLRSWQRSRIPIWLAESMARVVKKEFQ